MKAIRVHQFGGPEQLQLEEVPDPDVLEGQVLVSVRAAGVNPVDTYLRSGSNPKLPLPYTPGLDGAGVVEAAGAGAKARPGDRVYLSGSLTGTYAEKALCSAHQVHPLPQSVSFAEGAALSVPYVTAYRALYQKARVVPGETVLIHGASGAVGLASVQWARSTGVRVIGTAGTEAGCQRVLQYGAHHVLNHRQTGYLDQLQALTEGHGVDVILEMLANVNLGRDLTVLARFGRVVVIGSRGTVEINPREAMSRDAQILGLMVFNTPAHELASIHKAIQAALESRVIQPVIARELPLAQAALAHQQILEPGTMGKIVLVPGGRQEGW